jgi:hypothetical protein
MQWRPRIEPLSCLLPSLRREQAQYRLVVHMLGSTLPPSFQQIRRAEMP